METLSFFLDQFYPYTVTPDPDGGFFVAFPDLPGCITQVERADEIGPAADEIRMLWIETAFEQGLDIPLPRDGSEFSGKFVVRVPRHLHRVLVESAGQDGVSLNQYVVSLLAAGNATRQLDRRLMGIERRLEDIQSRLRVHVTSAQLTRSHLRVVVDNAVAV